MCAICFSDEYVISHPDMFCIAGESSCAFYVSPPVPPREPVSCAITTLDLTEGRTIHDTNYMPLVFTPGDYVNWAPKIVVVTGVRDWLNDGDRPILPCYSHVCTRVDAHVSAECPHTGDRPFFVSPT